MNIQQASTAGAGGTTAKTSEEDFRHAVSTASESGLLFASDPTTASPFALLDRDHLPRVGRRAFLRQQLAQAIHLNQGLRTNLAEAINKRENTLSRPRHKGSELGELYSKVAFELLRPSTNSSSSHPLGSSTAPSSNSIGTPSRADRGATHPQQLSRPSQVEKKTVATQSASTQIEIVKRAEILYPPDIQKRREAEERDQLSDSSLLTPKRTYPIYDSESEVLVKATVYQPAYLVRNGEARPCRVGCVGDKVSVALPAASGGRRGEREPRSPGSPATAQSSGEHVELPYVDIVDILLGHDGKDTSLLLSNLRTKGASALDSRLGPSPPASPTSPGGEFGVPPLQLAEDVLSSFYRTLVLYAVDRNRIREQHTSDEPLWALYTQGIGCNPSCHSTGASPGGASAGTEGKKKKGPSADQDPVTTIIEDVGAPAIQSVTLIFPDPVAFDIAVSALDIRCAAASPRFRVAADFSAAEGTNLALQKMKAEEKQFCEKDHVPPHLYVALKRHLFSPDFVPNQVTVLGELHRFVDIDFFRLRKILTYWVHTKQWIRMHHLLHLQENAGAAGGDA